LCGVFSKSLLSSDRLFFNNRVSNVFSEKFQIAIKLRFSRPEKVLVKNIAPIYTQISVQAVYKRRILAKT